MAQWAQHRDSVIGGGETACRAACRPVGGFLLALAGMAWCLLGTVALAHPGVHHDIERVTDALANDPANVKLLVERGFLYRLDGDLKASLRDLDQAAKLDPAAAEVWAHRGMTLSAMGRDNEAEKELSRFLEAGRGSSAAFAERARIRARGSHPKQAIEDYTSALALEPDVELYMERGRLQEAIGRLDDAAAGYTEGLRKLGAAVVLTDALVRLEVRRGNSTEALRLIDTELNRAPVKTEWLLRRADVLEQIGKPAEARAEREAALAEAERSLASRTTGLHLLSRARALIALGRVEEARRDLNLAISKSPRFREATDLLKTLDTKPNANHTAPQDERGIHDDR